MMTVLFTCPDCGSAVHVVPKVATPDLKCDQCQHEFKAHFTPLHEQDLVETCAGCEKKDFYSQADFNRKLGVLIYLIPTAICLFLGLLVGIVSFFLFWLVDVFLFRRLPKIVVCYHCNTIYRKAENREQVPPYDHELNDRIVYSGQDFGGEGINPGKNRT